ncbi:Ribonuclease H-like superfamily [Arabidopsis suecica]|uniref:Ribonuclease H-like superfamily n=1 Tax=Arabidopsis suecica TaxID=45249 RepID=A0A8T1XC07_ARASU|nr:Ribonuclease H-like superfamily [Arabidopsis suecica]
MHVDGASSRHGSGIGVRLESPTGEILEQSFRLGFPTSNNEAIRGSYRRSVPSPWNRVFELTKIRSNDNATANALTVLASTSDPDLRRVILVECIDVPSIKLQGSTTEPSEYPVIDLTKEQPSIVMVILPPATDRSEDAGRFGNLVCSSDPADGIVTKDKWATRILRARSAQYTLHHEHLLRWSATGVLLSSLDDEEAQQVMREIHVRAGGNHSGGRALALKIRKHGQYWPTMNADCEKFVSRCEKCQRHAPFIHIPSEVLQTAAPPHPFMRWAMDIIGPFPASRNGQAEATNKTILDGLKKRLDEKKGAWADELDGVLWSYRTTPRRSADRTPFSLTYGMEALAPSEAGLPTVRHSMLINDPTLNDQMVLDNLDNLEEQQGDLILRKVFKNTVEQNAGKLRAHWEGPYLISKVVKPGVYEPLIIDGTPIPRSWNSANLKRYYY